MIFVIKWKNEIVAKSLNKDLIIKLGDKAPLILFGKNKEVYNTELIKWMKNRVFPENRLGVHDLLKELGMTEYNPVEIAFKTRAILTGTDYYSVELYDDHGNLLN